MINIKNVKVYGLDESIIRSGLAMRTELPNINNMEESDVKRGLKLGNAKTGSGHDNFLKGVVVQFDLLYPEYLSPEMQRYHWFEIITSMSKMHRLSVMNIRECCNEWVDDRVIDIVENLRQQYNDNKTFENFMRLLSNCPLGLEKWMAITTNYLQLKTIYYQRRKHKLMEWRVICDWIENLPHFQVLCLGKLDEN